MKQDKQAMLEAKITEMQTHLEEVGNLVNELLKKRRRYLGYLKERKSLHEVEQNLCTELHPIFRNDKKIANVLKMEVDS